MSPRPDKIIIRQKYLDKALLFKGISLIKVFTGQRRTGKSYLMPRYRTIASPLPHDCIVWF